MQKRRRWSAILNIADRSDKIRLEKWPPVTLTSSLEGEVEQDLRRDCKLRVWRNRCDISEIISLKKFFSTFSTWVVSFHFVLFILFSSLTSIHDYLNQSGLDLVPELSETLFTILESFTQSMDSGFKVKLLSKSLTVSSTAGWTTPPRVSSKTPWLSLAP